MEKIISGENSNKFVGGDGVVINYDSKYSAITGGKNCSVNESSSYSSIISGMSSEDNFFINESLKLGSNKKIFKYFPTKSSWKSFHNGELIIDESFSFINCNAETKVYDFDSKKIGVLIIEIK